MKKAPLVSVLVTVYNREAYLAETLSSVLNSSWTDFELLIVDDASSDGSFSVAREFADLDTRVVAYRNETNLGDYSNRIRAAALATGRYIKYVDSDDLIYKYTLASMVESLEGHPDAALALAHSKPEDDSPYPCYLTSRQAYQKHFLGQGCLSCGPTGAIIRREAFCAVGGFDPEWKVLADAELWLRLACRWPIVLLPPGLVWWRRHGDQEYSKQDAARWYLEHRYRLSFQTLTNPDCPLDQVERTFALKRRRQHHARRLLSLGIRQRRLSSSIDLYRKSGLTISDLVSGLRPYI